MFLFGKTEHMYGKHVALWPRVLFYRQVLSVRRGVIRFLYLVVDFTEVEKTSRDIR